MKVQGAVDHWRSGDYPKSFDAYRDYMRLFTRPLSDGAGVRWTKAAFKALGLPGHHLRDPHLPVSDAELKQVADHLKKHRVKEIEGIA